MNAPVIESDTGWVHNPKRGDPRRGYNVYERRLVTGEGEFKEAILEAVKPWPGQAVYVVETMPGVWSLSCTCDSSG